MIRVGKLLMPIIRVNTGIGQTGIEIYGKAKFRPEDILEKLGNKKCTIKMQCRGIDTIGSTGLEQYKLILANYAKDTPGLPATNVFCINKTWEFVISQADNPEVIEFISKDYNIHSITKGPMELKSFESNMAPNWILGHFFRLKGTRFECLPADPIINMGGLESSNMLIGAATMAGSILTGADYDLGQIFYLATLFENRVHQGLTSGQGLAAGILGGAQTIEWPIHLHSYGGIASELFGPNRYQDFQDHVSFLLPGKERTGSRSSIDINRKWIKDALTFKGMNQQSIFTGLSQEAAAGYRNPGGIDWERVASAVQTQTDIRATSCPACLEGAEDLAKQLVIKKKKKVYRAVARPGAGGYGTPLIVYSTSKELAEEAKALIGQKLDITPDMTAEIKKSKTIPRGWIDYRLSDRPIQFNGFKEAGFNNPGTLWEIIIKE